MNRAEAIESISKHLADFNSDCKYVFTYTDTIRAWIDELCGNMYALIGIGGIGMVELWDIDGFSSFEERYDSIHSFIESYFNSNDFIMDTEEFYEEEK